ncbi:TIGR03943 family putative permease subunit [uncultured Desulfosarcina sp.]|uniref:TIGR03943 family putative permease subunit n=1 Tax=uncultured Desulfosarcina sp. TaxID=218289 RepID=UPI0029C6A0DF|nr:TIGR03943 family protein [uncultured Desulfosarcina sp.]
MNAADRFFQRWLSPILFGIWSASLLYLIASQRYTAFLRPGFRLLLVLAHFIAMGFMIAAMPGERPSRLDFSGVLRAVVLLVPILFLMTMPEATLGSRAFKNRFVGTAGITAALPGPPAPPPRGIYRSDRELTVFNLFLNPERFEGQRVTFTGMMLHDEQLGKYFGGRDTAVFRFLINCCAADALPLAVAVDSDRARKMANDQWVRVEGIFHLCQIEGDAVPVVEDAAVQPVDAPKFPYLY